MCWKQEWASSINNLQTAITHIERAEKKLEKRELRNKKNLKRLEQNKKYNYPAMLEPVKKMIEKNRNGEESCKDITKLLKETQDRLFLMIKIYGIKQSSKSKRLYRLMGKYKPKGKP